MNLKRTLLVVLVMGACSAPSWDGSVSQWGTLREVLRDGHTQGRIRLDAIPATATMGIGALENLAGEVTILDGRIWTARADEHDSIRVAGARADDQAAFLAVANVRGWQDFELEEPVGEADLEAKLAELAGERETLPFVVEGDIGSLDAHVLDGACPFASDPEKRGEPMRFHVEQAKGHIVGFFTLLPAGTLTHHDSRLHVHVLLDDGSRMGHVDRVVMSGTLRVPVL